MVKAVIDLGTNTFHLLIAETDQVSTLRPLHQKRAYVFLAREGLDRISGAAVEQAIIAARSFKDIIDRVGVDRTVITGTEALRTASNGQYLAGILETTLECPIHIISGETEAKMIGRGVEAACGKMKLNAIAIDIGGGSTEMVFLSDSKTERIVSATCGIAYLHKRFHRNDPIIPTEIARIEDYIRMSYIDFIDAIRQETLTVDLIGVAGSFEVLMHSQNPPVEKLPHTQLTPFDIEVVHNLLKELTPLNAIERELHQAIPRERSLYIIEALLIIRTISQMITFESCYVSDYSIKHGLLLSDF